jgi:hypothetical protein
LEFLKPPVLGWLSLFSRFGKFSAIILFNMFFYALSFHLFSYFYAMVHGFGFSMVFQRSCMIYSYFFSFFPLCLQLHVLISLHCPQVLIFCLQFDPVYWTDFQLSFLLTYWTFYFLKFSLIFFRIPISLLNSYFMYCIVFFIWVFLEFIQAFIHVFINFIDNSYNNL